MFVELDSFFPGIDDESASAATEFLDEGCVNRGREDLYQDLLWDLYRTHYPFA